MTSACVYLGRCFWYRGFSRIFPSVHMKYSHMIRVKHRMMMPHLGGGTVI